MSRRLAVGPALALAFLVCAPESIADPRNKDSFAASSARVRLTGAERATLRDAAKPGTHVQMEQRLGVPTMLWAAEPTGAAPVASGAAQAARQHLRRLRHLYRLSAADVQSAEVASVQQGGDGPVVVKLRQSVAGVPVFREEANVVMTPDLDLVGIGGYLSPARGAPAFALGARQAVAAALSDLRGRAVGTGALDRAGDAGGYERFASADIRFTAPARARKVMYRLPARLVSAYHVELQLGGADPEAFGYVIAADDARVLSRFDLVSDAFSYRVWAQGAGQRYPDDGPQGTAATPHPTGLPDGFTPPFVAPSLVTLASGPISTGDPWLAAGATETAGNNVDAYADLVAPDGFTPGLDVRANTTGPDAFDRVYDPTLQPTASVSQTKAAVTQLFYTTNWLHDWFYDAGFDESSGNAQDANFGRGGVAGDSMRAEAQDFGGLDNSSMDTPADGGHPHMQMYVFTGRREASVRVNSPASIAGTHDAGVAASFGPQTFDVTGDLAVVDDGSATTSDACEAPFANAGAVAGRIAVIDRGTCGFTVKAKNAQDAGAAGVLIVNNDPTVAVAMGGADASVTVPTLSVSGDDGGAMKAALASGAVNVTLHRLTEPNRDGAIDNQIVAHEWGHYLSNRLVADSAGLGTQMAGGLGEGWGDFVALLMTVRPEDALLPANAAFGGAYPLAGYATAGPVGADSHYFGMRRVPYSTDFTKDGLTFKHISDGVALPNVPTHANGAPNSEVHNTGEVWATMLWECYAALLRDTLGPDPRLTFDEAQRRMRNYLVASLKLTPPDPTLLEARDALLMAAFAADGTDFARFWQAFARRGAGTAAVAPDRNSATNSPVVESFTAGGILEFVSATLRDEVLSCDRSDGFLDNWEVGRLSITLRNEGAVDLAGTTATITPVNPHVVLKDNRITFPASGPFETTRSSTLAVMQGTTGIQTLDFTISFDDPALDPAGPYSARLVTYGGANVKRSASTSDDVESPVSAWTPRTDLGSSGWTRTTSLDPFNALWNGPDADGPSDVVLTSPALAVGKGPLSFSFRHRFSFEPAFDGGVIELSQDGGTTWTDIGAGYTGALVDTGDNPLRGRQAYSGASPAYPGFATQTISLGTAYARKTIMVRFRVGTDAAMGDRGWDVDDIQFTGLTNKPFHALVADAGCRRAPSVLRDW